MGEKKNTKKIISKNLNRIELHFFSEYQAVADLSEQAKCSLTKSFSFQDYTSLYISALHCFIEHINLPQLIKIVSDLLFT